MVKNWAIAAARALVCRKAAAMVEYALLAALIALVALVSVRSMGSNLGKTYGTIAASV